MSLNNNNPNVIIPTATIPNTENPKVVASAMLFILIKPVDYFHRYTILQELLMRC